jgi:hypothetical protein
MGPRDSYAVDPQDPCAPPQRLCDGGQNRLANTVASKGLTIVRRANDRAVYRLAINATANTPMASHYAMGSARLASASTCAQSLAAGSTQFRASSSSSFTMSASLPSGRWKTGVRSSSSTPPSRCEAARFSAASFGPHDDRDFRAVHRFRITQRTVEIAPQRSLTSQQERGRRRFWRTAWRSGLNSNSQATL